MCATAAAACSIATPVTSIPFGVSRESLLGRRATDSLPLARAQREAFEQVYQQAVATGQPIIGDHCVNLDDGRVLTLYHWTLPYRGSDGAVAGLICGWLDVTERQGLYEAVRQARDNADAANRAKTRFLATASHEIRTPMNAVLGMLELARRHAEQGQVNEVALEVASEAASGLLALLDDVLDISRIEAGQLSLHPQPIALNDVIEACVRLFHGQARHRGVHLQLAQRGGPWAVQADPLRLRQLLGNLLGNAIKFTPKGEVRVRLLAAAQGEHLQVRLVVIDNGIGIPAGDLARLGQPWSQATNHQQGNLSGSGLGLNICHHLARLMGGELRLSSQLGKGTRVELRLLLPLAQLPASQPPPVAGEPPAQAPLHILVVEDYTPSRLLLDQQLRHLGHRVTLANDGKAGLRAWLAEPFDRVICDCHMPGMDGYQLARAIRLAEQRQGARRCACWATPQSLAAPSASAACVPAWMTA
ncbi:hybrid sensor histidine kinase/response regulator [Pseudomonas sp. KNUC1026]|uniref:hybrid sensor histidine kinase/response regulator n=1 Tax=Pseudomonas sp. KNUC1026 TaxID=2893890 RepID=UPI001F30D99C|nr:ATP-binding protein [Pseudomonas sp. KNUC1026]UFH47984.1 response regulator [Pseudomonas sp. KNUC1026]